MASPVHCGERATGYGVALLSTLFGDLSESSFLKTLAPSSVLQNGQCENGSASKKMRLS